MEDISTITKEELLSADLIEEIFEEEDLTVREETITACQERAKLLGCKGAFTDLVKAQKKKIREIRKQMKEKTSELPVEQHTYTIATDDDDIVTYNTGRWMVSENGIVTQGKDGPIVASYYPIIITKCFVNRETAEEKLELQWKKKGAVKTMPVARNIVSSNRDIVKLSINGFPATSENAKHIVRYLADFEALNDIPHEISTSKYGWVDDKFVPYTDKIVFDGSIDIKFLADSIQTHGDYREWLAMIRKIRASGRKEPVLYLAAAFGSVLLYGLNLDPFIVNLYGDTGKGKTVSLMLAASVWANPSGRGYISESTSTTNALEIKLNALNHLPLMIDDLSKIRTSDKEKLVDFIYLMCAGGGRNRLKRTLEMRNTPTWKNIIMSNIERPLTDDTMKAGALNRVLDFEIEAGDIYKDGNEVVNAVVTHYGHAGIAFVEAVKEVGWDAIKEKVDYYRTAIKERTALLGDEKENKQIIPLAVLLTADWLSEQYLFKDGVRLDFDYCVKSIKSKKQVSEMERAYKHFVDAYHINRTKFDALADYGEIWGKKLSDYYVAVIPAALEKIASVYNFNAAQFITWCKDTGRLEHDKDRNQKYVQFGQDRTRCYVIRVDEAMSDTAYITGDTDPLPDEPLPFDLPR